MTDKPLPQGLGDVAKALAYRERRRPEACKRFENCWVEKGRPGAKLTAAGTIASPLRCGACDGIIPEALKPPETEAGDVHNKRNKKNDK